MTEYKKLIPVIGCRGSQAIDRNGDICSTDILTLCRNYCDCGADELLIYDCSKNDEEHEKTIGMFKELVRQLDVPVVVGGRTRRLEDIKKYLYAGAKAAFLEAEDEENVDLIKEAANRFGHEKIYVRMVTPAVLKRAEEFLQLGASKLILDMPDAVSAASHLSLPEEPSSCVWILSEENTDAIAASLSGEKADGVILILSEDNLPDLMEEKQQLKNRQIAVDTFTSSVEWKDFKRNSDGMVPVVVQDYQTMEVLMVAYMNEESFQHTLRSGKMTYYSRSRQELWIKGATSGHYQYVKSLMLDCDNDTILAKVKQIGAACHTGARSCFFQSLAEKEYKNTNPLKVFEDVYQVILDRKEHPKEGSYTNYLFDKGIDKILKKVGEEATEIIIAAKNPDPEEIKYEISDFLYHVMVLMAVKGVTWEEITEELANR